jgi:hypothetical protein
MSWGVILNWMVREDLMKKVSFGQTPRGEGGTNAGKQCKNKEQK